MGCAPVLIRTMQIDMVSSGCLTSHSKAGSACQPSPEVGTDKNSVLVAGSDIIRLSDAFGAGSTE